MKGGAIVARIALLPLRHKLMAVGISLAIFVGCRVGTLLLAPLEYSSSALLSFDGYPAPDTNSASPQDDHKRAAMVAGSILSDEAIRTLCWQLDLIPEDSRGGEEARFRSGLTLSEVSPSQLRVSWRGPERSQSLAATNAVAVLLSTWVPGAATQEISDAGPPSHDSKQNPAAPSEPTSPRVNSQERSIRLARLLDEQKQLELQIADTDQRLAALGEKKRKLDEHIKQVGLEMQRETAARQPLFAELSAEQKKLESLRARYTDAYPDVEAEQERVAEVETRLNAMPAGRPPSDTDQALLNSVTKEMNDLAGQRAHLVHQISENARLEKILVTHGVEGSTRAAGREQASAGPKPLPDKPILSDASGPVSSDASVPVTLPLAAGSTVRDNARPFTVLVPAADAQPTNRRYYLLQWTGAWAGPVCGFLYLVLAAWWLRAVRDAEMLEKIMPENVAYLGAIPGMNRWQPNP